MINPQRFHHPAHLQADPQPTTLAVKVYEELRQDIRSGSLAPGQPLRTEWLKTHYQTGVSPLREALARLAAEYFVTAEGKRGFQVSEISEDDFDQLVDVRQDLEARALERSIANGNDDWEAEIVANYHKLARTTPPGLELEPAGDEERELRHRRFHHALLSACGSRWQMRFLEHLTSHIERYRRIKTPRSSISKKTAREIETEHRLLMESTINRNTTDALKILGEHRHRTYSAIKDRFAEDRES
jgi:GntR family transcriptional regulator, carbon starvation induced regulator